MDWADQLSSDDDDDYSDGKKSLSEEETVEEPQVDVQRVPQAQPSRRDRGNSFERRPEQRQQQRAPQAQPPRRDRGNSFERRPEQQQRAPSYQRGDARGSAGRNDQYGDRRGDSRSRSDGYQQQDRRQSDRGYNDRGRSGGYNDRGRGGGYNDRGRGGGYNDRDRGGGYNDRGYDGRGRNDRGRGGGYNDRGYDGRGRNDRGGQDYRSHGGDRNDGARGSNDYRARSDGPGMAPGVIVRSSRPHDPSVNQWKTGENLASSLPADRLDPAPAPAEQAGPTPSRKTGGGLRNPQKVKILKKPEPPKQMDQGVIVSTMSDSQFGFIKSCSEDRDFFFSFRDTKTSANDLRVGDEVEYEVVKSRRNKGRKGGDYNAVGVTKLKPGTVQWDDVSDQTVYKGVITREAIERRRDYRGDKSRKGNADRSGRVRQVEHDGKEAQFSFGVADAQSGKTKDKGRQCVRVGDMCTFQVAVEKRTGTKHALRIEVTQTLLEQKQAFVSEQLKGKMPSFQGKISAISGRRGSIVPVGTRTSQIAFDLGLSTKSGAKGKAFKVDDEVEFKIVDVPNLPSAAKDDDATEFAVQLKKLKAGTVSFFEVVAKGAFGYVTKGVEFPRTSRSSRGRKGHQTAKPVGRGGVIELEDASLLNPGPGASPTQKKKKGGGRRSRSVSSNLKSDISFSSDDVLYTDWAWLGRDLPAQFLPGDLVKLDITRANYGKDRKLRVSNIAMVAPYKRGSHVQRASREYGTVMQVREGFALSQRSTQRGNILLSFSSVFANIRNSAAGGTAGNQRGMPPPLQERYDISFDVEDDPYSNDKEGNKRQIATRVVILPKGALAKRKTSVVSTKVPGVVTEVASNHGPGGRSGRGHEKGNGTIEVNASAIGWKNLQALFPLLQARLLDFRAAKSAKQLEVEALRCSPLKRYFLTETCREFGFQVKEASPTKSRSRVPLTKFTIRRAADGEGKNGAKKSKGVKRGKPDRKKKGQTLKAEDAAEPEEDNPAATELPVQVQFMPDALESIRTNLGVGDEVECELFVRNVSLSSGEVLHGRKIKVTKKKPIVIPKEYGIVAFYNKNKPVGYIECVSKTRGRYSFHQNELAGQAPNRDKRGKGSSKSKAKKSSPPLCTGDEVEFVVGNIEKDSRRTKRPGRRDADGDKASALKVKRLAKGTIAKKLGKEYRFVEIEGFAGKFEGVVVSENVEGASERRGRGVRGRPVPRRRQLGKIDVSGEDELKERFEAMLTQHTKPRRNQVPAKGAPEKADPVKAAPVKADPVTAGTEEASGESVEESHPKEKLSGALEELTSLTERLEKAKLEDSDAAMPRKAFLPVSFRTFDCRFSDGRVWIPRIGDVVEFSIAKDKLLKDTVVAYDIKLKSQHGVADKGVVENVRLGEDSEVIGGNIRSYEFRTNSVRFDASDIFPNGAGEQIALSTGDEVSYLLVNVGKKTLSGKGKPHSRAPLKAVNIELIKAAPKFRTSRQRVNQNLLLARLESGGHKGGMVLSKVAKAPDGTRGFTLKRTVGSVGKENQKKEEEVTAEEREAVEVEEKEALVAEDTAVPSKD